MNIIPHLLPIEKNSEKIRNEVLTNIIKMLTNRKLLKRDNLEENIKNIINQKSDDDVYNIKLDNPEIYYVLQDNNNVMSIKLLNQKITGISKNSQINDFLTKNSNPKIIVVQGYTQKVYDQIKYDYKYTEIFMEKELMFDIVSHISVPKHELLTFEQTKMVLDEYDIQKKYMPRIFITDPIAKYYNASVGQIMSITRPSIISGFDPYHRIVVKNIVSK